MGRLVLVCTLRSPCSRIREHKLTIHICFGSAAEHALRASVAVHPNVQAAVCYPAVQAGDRYAVAGSDGIGGDPVGVAACGGGHIGAVLVAVVLLEVGV